MGMKEGALTCVGIVFMVLLSAALAAHYVNPELRRRRKRMDRIYGRNRGSGSYNGSGSTWDSGGGGGDAGGSSG